MAFIEKADFKLSILVDELDQITRNDATIIDAAISASEAEMRAYLFDSYDVDTIFTATGTARHGLLVRFCVDISIWGIVASTQAGINLEDRETRYKNACRWLKMVKDMGTYADLPLKTETEQTHIIMGSQTKRNNYY